MATDFISPAHGRQQHPAKPARSWEVIATELCEEQDSDKVVDLCEELTNALDSRLRPSGMPTRQYD